MKCLDLNLLDLVTNHPVHIVDGEGRMSPSALIPFCDLGGDMSALGRNMQGFSQPVCSAFRRIVFNDQLCYQVNVSQYQATVETSQVYEKGISFLVDTNEDRQYSDLETTTEDTQQGLGIIHNYNDESSSNMNHSSFLSWQLRPVQRFSKFHGLHRITRKVSVDN